MPDISVVVPTFRRPAFLDQALASVVAQTLQDLEVLVCDNGADPDTRAVVERYADDRIRYLPREQNLGMLRNAMQGFAAARADLVMKLDDDDILVPDALERLVAPFADRPDLALSFGGVALVDEGVQPMPAATQRLDQASGRDRFPEGFIEDATALVAAGGVQLAGAVLRRDLLDWGAVPDEVGTAYDFHIALTAVEDRRPLHFTRAPVVHYRIHAASDTRQRFGEQLLAACAVLEAALERGRLDAPQPVMDRLALSTLDAARIMTQQGKTVVARRLLRRSLQLQPSLAAARLYALSYVPASTAAALARARGRRHTHGSRSSALV